MDVNWKKMEESGWVAERTDQDQEIALSLILGKEGFGSMSIENAMKRFLFSWCLVPRLVGSSPFLWGYIS